MARALTTAQQEALESPDRATHVRVDIEDADGVMVDVTDLDGKDWLDSVVIEASVDHPIAAVTVTLQREIDGVSIAPLIEGSELNEDSGGSYAPLANVSRDVDIYVATMMPGESPSASDWVKLAEGVVDRVSWGGRPSRLVLEGRDPVARLNSRIIETVSTYGGGSPLAQIEDVMQAILNAEFGSGVYPLVVEGTPSFGVREYELAHVSVLDALKALADLQGWNLHWKWDATASPAGFFLTYYEPVRDAASLSGYTPDWTFGPDDYYDVADVSVDLSGIRNAGEVVFTDADGDEVTITEERSGSIAEYGRGFIRLDERQGFISTTAQASALLAAVLDDTEDPPVSQQIEAAFHWPIELGDMHRYSANGDHYDTDQDWAVSAYRHELSANRKRTIVSVRGKPSGGYRRWHRREAKPQQYISRRETIPASAFGGDDGELTPSTTASLETFWAPLRLKVGSIITSLKVKGARIGASDTVEVVMASPSSYLGSPPLHVTFALATITMDVDASDWTEKALTDLAINIGASKPYSLRVRLNGNSSVDDAKFAWAEVSYQEPVN